MAEMKLATSSVNAEKPSTYIPTQCITTH